MLNETRAVVEKLYQSFNEDLATILQDNRFLWQKHNTWFQTMDGEDTPLKYER